LGLRKISLLLLKFYQGFLTKLKPNSCRYYPSCSAYAVIEFEHNNIFIAFYKSAIRILRCNQFFIGGIDHPVIKKHFSCSCPPRNTKHNIKTWFVPKTKDRYYVIKDFGY
jgi:putative membrane protein insertion efficiency factor